MNNTHLPPTPTNRRLLCEFAPKCCFLFRSPINATKAYQRIEELQGRSVSYTAFKILLCLQTIFYYEWKAFAEQQGYFITTFRQLILDPAGEVNRTFEYLEVKDRVPSDFQLPQKNYTGVGEKEVREQCHQSDLGNGENEHS